MALTGHGKRPEASQIVEVFGWGLREGAEPAMTRPLQVFGELLVRLPSSPWVSLASQVYAVGST
jgi:hypothetical protein